MQLRTASHVPARTPGAQRPSVIVLFGADGDPASVGLVRVTMEPGVEMPPHKHHGSDVIVTPVAGSVRMQSGQDTIEVAVGDSVLVGNDEAVSLLNHGTETAELIVAAGPTDFVATVARWPSAAESASVG